jgi:hypothetical protein
MTELNLGMGQDAFYFEAMSTGKSGEIPEAA